MFFHRCLQGKVTSLKSKKSNIWFKKIFILFLNHFIDCCCLDRCTLMMEVLQGCPGTLGVWSVLTRNQTSSPLITRWLLLPTGHSCIPNLYVTACHSLSTCNLRCVTNSLCWGLLINRYWVYVYLWSTKGQKFTELTAPPTSKLGFCSLSY